MSKHQVDEITDLAGTGAPDFPNGISQSGLKHLEANKSANTTGLSSSDITTVIFDNEINNSFSSEYNNVTGVFTASEAGFYLITASALGQSDTGGELKRGILWLYKNGSQYSRLSENGDSTDQDQDLLGLSGSHMIKLSASDTISIRYQGFTQTGTYKIVGSSNTSLLSVTKLG